MTEASAAAEGPGSPAVLFFHQGSVEAAELFFAKHAPGNRAVSDPDGVWFDAFGLRRGSVRELIGPLVWARALRALAKGNFVGRPSGDPLRLPGAFLVQGQRVLWQHRARHAGDLPDLGSMRRVLQTAGIREAG